LVIVKKIKECSKSYPRKAGLITKDPLKWYSKSELII
jgi:16S rRNA (guanine527-N7)-methyltransferase